MFFRPQPSYSKILFSPFDEDINQVFSNIIGNVYENLLKKSNYNKPPLLREYPSIQYVSRELNMIKFKINGYMLTFKGNSTNLLLKITFIESFNTYNEIFNDENIRNKYTIVENTIDLSKLKLINLSFVNNKTTYQYTSTYYKDYDKKINRIEVKLSTNQFYKKSLHFEEINIYINLDDNIRRIFR
jgi:hypothetical protein